MFLVYLVFAGVWGWLCYKHRTELLPIQVRLPFLIPRRATDYAPQYYLSSLIGLIVIEMLASWGTWLSPTLLLYPTMF